jgi:hypothetical protein
MVLWYHSRKYSLNENFFSLWNSEMAYVLGFWYADGHMRHVKSYRIYFSSNDVQILKDIRKAMRSNSPVISSESKYPTLVVRSKKLYSCLLRLGGAPRKSTKITFPKVPVKYLPDFIRGYFDGDGSVHKITYRASKNNKKYTEIRSNFTCGSKPFLESLREKLVNYLDTSNRVIGQYGPHQFKLGYGQKDTVKLLRFMYYNSNIISLKRKSSYLLKI